MMVQSTEVKLMSLNVNGLGNPIKRSKVLTKFKKEKADIIFMQETHLSQQEHEKLKRFGFKNTYYNSYEHSHRRGIAILVANKFKFELYKEIKEKDGRYLIVKGKIEEELITLVNVYAPPDTSKLFFKSLMDVIVLEAEGICICGGDFNVVLNHHLDTTNSKRNGSKISKLINTAWDDIGYCDVWRHINPTLKNYTHYSAPHRTYSRIDYFFMPKNDCYRVKDCSIGVAEVSDHSALYLTVQIEGRKRKTGWRLNVGLLNNKANTEQIKLNIKEYIRINDNGEVDPSIVWDSLKAVMRGNLIALSAQNKKKRIMEYNTLTSDLLNVEQQHKINRDPNLLSRMQQIRKQINSLLEQDVEKKARFYKQTYYESGPKAAKLLARRLRKQEVDSTIHRIRDPQTNNLVHHPQKIEDIFLNYYKQLYTDASNSKMEATRNFLNELDLPSIGKIQNDFITADFTLEEINNAIGRLKTSKTPGSDGFPAEWYKTFKEILAPLLLKTFNWIKTECKLPPSWNEAIISVLPKEGKDREFSCNYRPISILNIDYKIYTSIIAKRLETILPELIDEDQTGFIKSRQTHDNIRRTLHLIDKIERENKTAVLLSLDAEKAFDRVNWEFLYQTLVRFGFNKHFVNIIRSLYQQPTAKIKINGSLSPSFSLQRGTRQGCCLSPTLFAVYIEPLAQAIRQHEQIQGITIGHKDHLISLFADDVLIHLTDPEASLPVLMEFLDEFNFFAGYKLNIAKTQLLSFNYKPTEEIRHRYKLKWDMKEIKYLGVIITKNLSSLYGANYNVINQSIKSDMERWSTYPLDFASKINVIKTNILPRLLYLFQALPVEIPKHQFTIWNKLISRFIWDGKKPRIRYTTLQLSKQKGGMALPNLKDYFYAAQFRPLFLWCNNNYFARWKEIETYTVGYQIQSILGEKEIPSVVKSQLDSITSGAVEFWFEFARQFKLSKDQKVLRWIAFDTQFKPGESDATFKQWATKGISAICTVLENKELQTFQTLKEKLSLTNRDLFRFIQFRDYFYREIKMETSHEISPVVKIMMNAYKSDSKCAKIISSFYVSIMESKTNSTLYLKSRWEKELNVEILPEVWLDMCEIQHSSTSSQQLRVFNWKNLVRFFITPKISSKASSTPQQCWRKCGCLEAHHTHIFWGCEKLKPFWNDVHLTLTKVLGYEIPFTCIVLYLGHISLVTLQEDRYLVKILLTAARKTITRSWYKPDSPKQQQWLDVIQEIRTLEHMTGVLRLKVDLYAKRWQKWIIYIDKSLGTGSQTVLA